MCAWVNVHLPTKYRGGLWRCLLFHGILNFFCFLFPFDTKELTRAVELFTRVLMGRHVTMCRGRIANVLVFCPSPDALTKKPKTKNPHLHN